MWARMNCPKCSDNVLYFHQMQGMRLKRENDKGEMVYDVRCKECGDFEMKAPKG